MSNKQEEKEPINYKLWNDIYKYKGITIRQEKKIYDGKSNEKKRYLIRKKYNAKILEDMDKSMWADMDSCLDYAMDYHNHVAFALYYLSKVDARKKAFAELLEKYCQNAKIMLTQTKILSAADGFWRCHDARLEYVDKEWHVRIYDISDVEESDYKCTVAYNTLNGWSKGAAYPRKDEIIQLGFWLELNSMQVDQLLNIAGYSALYKPNLVDSICIYYLDKYSSYNKYGEYEKVSPPTAVDKILEVKSMINSYGKKGYKNTEYRRIKKERTPAAGSSPYYYEGVSTSSFLEYDESNDSWNIKKEIEQLKKEIPDLEEYQDRVTYFMNHQYEEIDKDTTLDEYLNSDISIFDNKRYGLLSTLSEYLDDFSTISKNLVEAISDSPCKDDERFLLEPSSSVNMGISKITECLILEQFITDEKYQNVYQNNKEYNRRVRIALNNIMFNPNIIEINGVFNHEPNVKRFSGDRTIAAELISGRKIRNKEEVNENSDAETLYRMGITDRGDLIKLCVALGQEDDLVNLMNLAGFVGYGGEDFVNDCTDYIVSYAIKYRDMLIDEWADYEDSGQSDIAIKNECKNVFPFVRLLMNIYRDIQLVKQIQFDSDYCKITAEYNQKINSAEYTTMSEEDRTGLKKDIAKNEQRLFDEQKAVLKGMMFPVKCSVKAWFLVKDRNSRVSYEDLIKDERMKLGWDKIAALMDFKVDWEERSKVRKK